MLVWTESTLDGNFYDRVVDADRKQIRSALEQYFDIIKRNCFEPKTLTVQCPASDIKTTSRRSLSHKALSKGVDPEHLPSRVGYFSSQRPNARNAP